MKMEYFESMLPQWLQIPAWITQEQTRKNADPRIDTCSGSTPRINNPLTLFRLSNLRPSTLDYSDQR